MKNAWVITYSIIMLSYTVTTLGAPSPECTAEGIKYQQLGMKAGSQKDYSGAANWLEKAVRTCQSYKNYHLLGRSQQHMGHHQSALKAYEKAQALAQTPNDQAISVARYGQVLNMMGHPIEALPLIQAAREMHSDPPTWVTDLALELDDSMTNRKFTADEIHRGGLSESSSGGFLTIAALASPPTTDTVAVEKPKQAINYKINFDFNSTEMDDLSLKNVLTLAKVLGSQEYVNKTIWLIGHSDVRGDERYNQRLSEHRAEAVLHVLTDKIPSLKGRLHTKGMGESKPLYLGDSEKIHRNNRRLQVLLE
jgi:outer membrane protein OmpA-like peptidoglycan-associated protein